MSFYSGDRAREIRRDRQRLRVMHALVPPHLETIGKTRFFVSATVYQAVMLEILFKIRTTCQDISSYVSLMKRFASSHRDDQLQFYTGHCDIPR
jgi:hypothetical protein